MATSSVEGMDTWEFINVCQLTRKPQKTCFIFFMICWFSSGRSELIFLLHKVLNFVIVFHIFYLHLHLVIWQLVLSKVTYKEGTNTHQEERRLFVLHWFWSNSTVHHRSVVINELSRCSQFSLKMILFVGLLVKCSSELHRNPNESLMLIHK